MAQQQTCHSFICVTDKRKSNIQPFDNVKELVGDNSAISAATTFAKPVISNGKSRTFVHNSFSLPSGNIFQYCLSWILARFASPARNARERGKKSLMLLPICPNRAIISSMQLKRVVKKQKLRDL